MKLAIIAAIGRNRVIGKEGKLPWHISEDLKRFKKLTTGHAVLMGRRTFESLGRPLSGRRNVVLSSRPISGTETYTSVPEALKALATDETVYIIGGAQLYAEFLDKADELNLTLVDREVAGDAFFPEYEHLIGTRFRLVRREDHDGFSFIDFIRISR
jgi:dihydrofolate reductase